jgi:hypothetical protein
MIFVQLKILKKLEIENNLLIFELVKLISVLMGMTSSELKQNKKYKFKYIKVRVDNRLINAEKIVIISRAIAQMKTHLYSINIKML